MKRLPVLSSKLLNGPSGGKLMSRHYMTQTAEMTLFELFQTVPAVVDIYSFNEALR